jgi:hypothetical protein
VMQRVTKVEMSFFITMKGGSRVVRAGELGGRWRYYRLNASVSTRDGRQRDEVLPENNSESVLALWKGSMTRHDNVRRRKGGTG